MSPSSPFSLGLDPPFEAVPGNAGGGGGGAGGASGISGGGGADGAPIEGIGGGGGGATGGSPPSSKLPGIGDACEGERTAVGTEGAGLLGLSTDFLSSSADIGLGGAIVPNSMDASCFALPPVGLSAFSSSSEDEVESTTDHSSSSGRTREGRLPVGVDDRGGGRFWDFADSCCCVRRWNGFVDSTLAFGEMVDEDRAGGSFACCIFLKNGFFVSAPWGIEAATGVGAGGGSVGTAGGSITGAGVGLVGCSDAARVEVAGGDRSDG